MVELYAWIAIEKQILGELKRIKNMSYSNSLYKLRDIANDGDIAVSSRYSKEAEKIIKPKVKGEPNGQHEFILNQIETEYQEAYTAFKTKISKYLTRLKLYNNQIRAEDAVGYLLIFQNHQTIIASLYYDRLQVEFEPREEGDTPVAENMNYLAEFDYEEMWKPWNDYQWDWDVGFYGWGLKWLYEFDRKSKTPIQTVGDPASFLRDPRAKSVNGDRSGSGAMRFGGLEVFMTMREMEENPEYFNLAKLRKYGKGDYNTLAYEADRSRRTAQGIESFSSGAEGENEHYCILRWLTHIRIGDKVRKCIVETGNERSIIIRITPLETELWPLIKRDMYPMSHSWDGVSVCDLTEDKQRFGAMLANVLAKSARADVEPMYLFDKTKVTPQTDFKFGFNKFIPINGPAGESVVFPLRKAQPGSQAYQILAFLDESTQRALATPEIRQGVPSKDQRTLGEVQLQSAGVDTRYSLTARLWGISEKTEWGFWYNSYERNFEKGIDEKALRLSGAFGPQWRKLTRENVVANNPQGLDIKIESKEVASAKKQKTYAAIGSYVAAIAQDPEADRKYAFRFLGRQIATREQIERILPLTAEEILAKKENEDLNENKPVKVEIWHDHSLHRRINAEAKESEARKAHLKAHEEMEIVKKLYPQLFPRVQNPQAQVDQGLGSQAPAMANQLGGKRQPNQNRVPQPNELGQ